MGDSKQERARAIDEALEKADKVDRLEEDEEVAAEVDRAAAAITKARKKKDKPQAL